MGKSKDQFFFKSQGKSVGALEYPDQEPYWSGGILECRSWRMEPDRRRVSGQDEVQFKWSSMPRGARGDSSYQDHAQEEHSSERAANEQDAHHCRGH